MYQTIAETAVADAEEVAKKSPDYKYGAINVAIGVVGTCRKADLDAIPLEEMDKRNHVYAWAEKCIERLKKIL